MNGKEWLKEMGERALKECGVLMLEAEIPFMSNIVNQGTSNKTMFLKKNRLSNSFLLPP